jgi:hypothetical protein
LGPSRPREGAPLKERWARLHETDREPWPDERRVADLARRHSGVAAAIAEHGGSAAMAMALQAAWGAFHAGRFGRAIKAGQALGALGAVPANKAAAVESLYPARGSDPLRQLEAALERAERAVAELADQANVHYTLALVLGRYSQRISILKALAAGLAGRVREHLERALALEPRHAEAHLAFGLYHAEIVAKLGGLAANLTYGATSRAALEHLRRALTLAAHSPIVRIEYANGLMLLDAAKYRTQAEALYAQAAACEPADAMERLDVERARGGLPG